MLQSNIQQLNRNTKMLTCAKIDRKVKTRKGSKQKRNYRLNANIPMIAFNVKYLTMPIKRQRL